MSTAHRILVAALIVLGALFVLLGSTGLARLPDFLTRLHGPTKATTLGVGALLLASAIFFSTAREPGISLHELAILLFLFITAPVTAHLLAKAALHRQPGAEGSGQGEARQERSTPGEDDKAANARRAGCDGARQTAETTGEPQGVTSHG
jgi:multicomponent K+:H+ antiporter subunit G